MYVDSHCHLSLDGLHQRIPEIRREMAAAQVDRALCICTTLEEFDTVHGLALAHDNFWCTVGVPEQFGAMVRSEIAKWTKVAARIGTAK